ncbi:MAG: glycosyltransferase [Acidobacteriota bacterium]
MRSGGLVQVQVYVQVGVQVQVRPGTWVRAHAVYHPAMQSGNRIEAGQGPAGRLQSTPLALHVRMGSAIVGGTDRALASLAIGMSNLGSELHLAVLDDGRTNWDLLHAFHADVPLTLHRLPADFRFDPLVGRRLARLARGIGASVIHAWDYKSDIAACASPLPWVATLHGMGGASRRLRFYSWLDRIALKRAARVFAVSEALAATHKGARKVRLVPNTVVAPATPPRQTVNCPHRLVAVGRMEAGKGFDLLLEAFAACLVEAPGLVLTLVGEGSRRASLEAQARHLALGERVRFTGWLADVTPALDAADLLVVPSLAENQPMVLLEAMARGLPAVVTSVGEMARLVTVPATGLIVPPGGIPALTAAILQATRSSFDSAAAWERVRAHHAPELLASIYFATYTEVVSAAPGARRR